ncbi:MAG: aminotransferase class I/II-fold pyridoxal phosphate-dependent enzyme, partial [Clostridia bacterium]|nr:aminotransferase class I/II-fold pyridoxal phosphate-dependent enzyme [Clostridia bacterium]
MSIRIDPSPYMTSLTENYLFSEVRARINGFLSRNGGEIINLGVGDVAYPLPLLIAEEMERAAAELADNARFRGYPPEGGYDFLKKAASDFYFKHGARVCEDEIFIGVGTKSDASAFTEIFGKADVIVPDPVYPVYADSAAMRGDRVLFLKGEKENGFLPMPDGQERKPWIIWICSPNNPAGSAYDGAQLSSWVNFALDTGSLILFDSAYSAFAEPPIPKTIYGIDGAKECAVEFFSFSKFAGFTNLRCSWVVVPNALKCRGARVNALWRRRQAAKFNGVCYPVQMAAAAALAEEGERECEKIVSVYKENAREISGFLKEAGVWHTGGKHSPYVWAECPRG